MAALNFPANPANGQTYTFAGRVWIYSSDEGAWQSTSNLGGVLSVAGKTGDVTLSQSDISLDGDLTAIAALTGVGILRRTGSSTWELDTTTYLSGNQTITLSGDVSGSGATAISVTLANTGVTAGSYGSSSAVPVITVDGKGRITSVSTSAISGSLTFTGDVTGSGTTGSSTALTLSNTGVAAGTYNDSATSVRPFTVDGKGRITAVGTAVTITPSWSSITSKPTTLSGYGITDAQPLDADLTAIAALAGSSGFLKKTAADTWSLDTTTYLSGNQTITLSGDAAGSGATAITVTLANSGVSAGTYTKVTVDAKGRVTTGANLASGDLPTYTGTITSSQVTTALGFTPENAANKGVANGYASLDASAKVPASQLPSYVDDVLEYANLAAFPGTGTAGLIYVALDTNKIYRWTGSTYVEISPSPGTTDSLTEGSTNLYFTTARSRSSVSAAGSLSYNASTGVFSYTQPTNVSTFTNDSGYLTGITSGQVTTALGYTPVNPANHLVLGTIGSAYTSLANSANGSLQMRGSTSNFILNVQDGSGRVSYMWNASGGTTSGTYLVSSEQAIRQTMTPGTVAGKWEWWGAPAGTAGAAITWTQYANMDPGNVFWWSPRGTSTDFTIDNSGVVSTGGSVRLGGGTSNPASTTFTHTIAGVSNSRVVNFDGNGNAPSVWWTNGATAIGAIDAIGGGGLSFWANNGSAWQSQISMTYGTVNVQTTLQQGGNQVLHAGNYNSYALPLSGGTLTGALTESSTTDQGLTLNATDNGWKYIGFSHSGTRKAYFGLDVSGNPTWGTDSGGFSVVGASVFTIAGHQALTANNYSNYALPLSGGTLTGSLTLSAPGTRDSRFVKIYRGSTGADQAGVTFGNAPSTDNWFIGHPYSGGGVFNALIISESAAINDGSGTLVKTPLMYFTPGSGTSAGNVGIATTAPGVRLDVDGTIRSRIGAFQLNDGSSTGGGLYFYKTISGGGSSLAPTLFAETGLPLYFATNGSATPKLTLDISGHLTLTGTAYFTDTTNGIYKSGGRLTVRSESTDDVANFASYGLYLPKTGQAAGLYVESPVEARGGLRLGPGATYGTITVGATTAATADRLVQRDGSGNIAAAAANFSGVLSVSGGAVIGVQNSQDGGTGRGIYMWNTGDSNWAIYMAQSGANKAISGGTAPAGLDGRTVHGIRFRAFDGATQIGFLWENSNNVALMQLQPNTGNMLLRGGIQDLNSSRFVSPEGAVYQTSAPSVTGAWKISLPVAKYKSNTMLRFTVKMYQYVTGLAHTFEIGGYNYNDAGATWYNVSAYVTTDAGATYVVRWGHDGTRQCVWIGETNSTWSYPQVVVTDVQAGYSGYDSGFNNGWSITPVTSFDTVSQSRTASRALNINNYSEYALPLSGGTVTGLTSFTAAESLNLYGIRGLFSAGSDSNGIHLFSNVVIGDPTGWGQGLSGTPSRGLATWGGINVAYGNGAASAFRGAVDVIAGNNSYITLGPNSTWGGSLVVGATTNKAAGQTAQVIATDGDLHLNAGTSGKDIYLNYYAAGRLIRAYGPTQFNGYAVSGAASYALNGGFTISDPGSGYAQFNNWVLLPGSHGFYSGVNSAHIYPNNGTFGAWRMDGSRNGYRGIEFGSGSNGVVAMMIHTNSNLSGFYNYTYGWQFYWEAGSIRCNKNNYGGGTDAFVLDSSNYSSYAMPLSGGTITGNLTVNSNLVVLSEAYSYSWWRSYNATGWYNQTYGGGIWMEDSTWVKVYGTKSFYGTSNIVAVGDVTAYYSDERLKTKTGTIEGAIEKVKRLCGFLYVENDLARELGYSNTRQQVGVSAQQVQAVMPEAVTLAPFDMQTEEFTGVITSKSGENYLTVKYERLVPLLIEAIKEQQAKIEELEARIDLLTA